MGDERDSNVQLAKKRLSQAAVRLLAGDRTACPEADDALREVRRAMSPAGVDAAQAGGCSRIHNASDGDDRR